MLQDGRCSLQKTVNRWDLCNQADAGACHPGVKDCLQHSCQSHDPFPTPAKLQSLLSQQLQAAIEDIDNASSTVKSWKSRTMLRSKVSTNMASCWLFSFKVCYWSTASNLPVHVLKIPKLFEDPFWMVALFHGPNSLWTQFLDDACVYTYIIHKPQPKST